MNRVGLVELYVTGTGTGGAATVKLGLAGAMFSCAAGATTMMLTTGATELNTRTDGSSRLTVSAVQSRVGPPGNCAMVGSVFPSAFKVARSAVVGIPVPQANQKKSASQRVLPSHGSRLPISKFVIPVGTPCVRAVDANAAPLTETRMNPASQANTTVVNAPNAMAETGPWFACEYGPAAPMRSQIEKPVPIDSKPSMPLLTPSERKKTPGPDEPVETARPTLILAATQPCVGLSAEEG